MAASTASTASRLRHIREALLFLAGFDPELGFMLRSHFLDGATFRQLGEAFGRNEDAVRHLINGRNRDGEWVPGAKDVLDVILGLLCDAEQCDDEAELENALFYSLEDNHLDQVFTEDMVYILGTATTSEVLCCLLGHLKQARADKKYSALIDRLLQNHDADTLEKYLSRLCPDGPGRRDKTTAMEGPAA